MPCLKIIKCRFRIILRDLETLGRRFESCLFPRKGEVAQQVEQMHGRSFHYYLDLKIEKIKVKCRFKIILRLLNVQVAGSIPAFPVVNGIVAQQAEQNAEKDLLIITFTLHKECRKGKLTSVTIGSTPE